jgi:sec-independent protein translocase protein TatB
MNFGLSEMLFLAVLGLLLVGPKKLPEMARQIGFWISEFKRVTGGFQQQLAREIQIMETSKALPAVPRTWSVANAVSDAPPAAVAEPLAMASVPVLEPVVTLPSPSASEVVNG